jgi:SAM-dependent methyltransferase
MKNNSASYQELWKNQVTPLHRENDNATYKAYAHELSNIFSYLGYKGGKVLEIGCGNGGLFSFFDFDIDLYKGIDFSPSLLQIFKDSHPNVSLIECDASKFIPNEKYDLIFGNAVHQHFSKPMLERHIINMLPALSEDGILVLGNLPYAYLRRHYLYGELEPKLNKSILFQLKQRLKYMLLTLLDFSDGIGFWYTLKDVENFVPKEYCINIFGSNFYPYRVHICIKRNKGI